MFDVLSMPQWISFLVSMQVGSGVAPIEDEHPFDDVGAPNPPDDDAGLPIQDALVREAESENDF